MESREWLQEVEKSLLKDYKSFMKAQATTKKETALTICDTKTKTCYMAKQVVEQQNNEKPQTVNTIESFPSSSSSSSSSSSFSGVVLKPRKKKSKQDELSLCTDVECLQKLDLTKYQPNLQESAKTFSELYAKIQAFQQKQEEQLA